MPTDTQRDELVTAALAVRERAHASYSGFQVGAALLAASGQIFRGVNVENASYGSTMCAEWTAVGSAVTAGETEFKALAVASLGGCTPCGSCRQVLAEFCRDLTIWLVDVDNGHHVQEVQLSDLYPEKYAFPPRR